MDLFRKKSKVGPKNLIRFYIALNLGEKCFFFAIQNLVDIQSSRFWWYSFVFERTQSRLVLFLVNFLWPESFGGAIRPTGLLFLFWHVASSGWYPCIVKIWIWLNHPKGHFERSERSNLAPFFSIYARSFPRRVLMHCQKMDSIESL